MGIDNLLITRENLVSNFNFDRLISLEEVASLYNKLEYIIINSKELQQFIADKQYLYTQAISRRSQEIENFVNGLTVLSDIYNKPFKEDTFYNLDFFAYIISDFQVNAGIDRNYRKYNDLFDYIMYLITDVINSYKNEEDWALLIKQTKHTINIKHSEYIDGCNLFMQNTAKILNTLQNLYDYNAYNINKNKLYLVSGTTLSLFLLPLKKMVQDLLEHTDSIIKNDNSYIDTKINIFADRQQWNGTVREVFICRCLHLDWSNDKVADNLGLSVASIEKATVTIRGALLSYLDLSEDEKRRLTSILKIFLSK